MKTIFQLYLTEKTKNILINKIQKKAFIVIYIIMLFLISIYINANIFVNFSKAKSSNKKLINIQQYKINNITKKSLSDKYRFVT